MINTNTHKIKPKPPQQQALIFSPPLGKGHGRALCPSMAVDFLHCTNITALEAYLETLCAFVDNPIMKFKRPNAIVSRKIYLLKGKQLSHK